jgi:tRNA-2-methylthio-N6-dimethylallyladenosine synthase
MKRPRPGDLVTVKVTDAGPYHLLADPASADEVVVSRTIGGDAFERITEETSTKRKSLSLTPRK